MSGGYTKKLVDINERSFLVQIVNFENGNFISVTENSEKIGGMIVSINSGPVPSTSTVIPPKSEALFLKLVSEKIAYSETGNPLQEKKPPKTPNTKSVRTSKWKLIVNEYNNTKELYDLENDPDENKNLIDCLLYTSPSPRDGLLSRMPSSA